MRFLSLFSGIEACSVAWKPLGWECVGFSEIDAFPCAALKTHYPDVPNLGDVTKITERQIQELGHIDVVVGGFPCQDLSVAGRRAGLKNADGSATRSGLFFDAVRIAGWAGARFTVIENVPGLFSSNDGRDFAEVVGALAGCDFDVPRDGWRNSGFAAGPLGLVEWCVLDAQFFGIPQRRRRIFIVRDSGDWGGRAPLLLERESLRRNPAPRREPGERVAPTVEARDLKVREDGTANALLTPNGGRSGIGVGAIAFGWQNSSQQGASASASRTQTLDISKVPAVAFTASEQANGYAWERDVVPTINAQVPNDSSNIQTGVRIGMQVRRLTPEECEALQGFPRGYTQIPYRGKPAADGPRYKALGNSMAVPVVRWIGERIDEMEAAQHEAA